MGVMLRPGEDPMPTEEELARIAGLVPGEVDQAKLLELQQSLNEKGFMVNETGLRMASQHQRNEQEAAEPTPMLGVEPGFELGQGDLGKSFMKDPRGTALSQAAKAMDELKKLRNQGSRTTH